MGTEMMLVVFIVLGIGLAFVIAWIVKSEKVREIYENEMKKMKRQFESKSREISILADRLEVSELIRNELEDFDRIKSLGETGQEVTDDVVRDMKSRLEELENENVKIDAELMEARDSLEEVYKAMCDE